MCPSELSLRELLTRFWSWAGVTEFDYAYDEQILGEEPFYYPEFDELRGRCIRMINSVVSDEELTDILTCIALDNEEEIVLDALKNTNNMDFVERLVKISISHLQPNARWQIAELLCFCKFPARDGYLRSLCADENEYVKKRARNTACFLKDTE